MALVFFLQACSVGGSGETLVPGTDPPASEAQTARFLTRATFGPTPNEIHRLSVIGYAAWFDEQRTRVPSLQKPALDALAARHTSFGQEARVEQWWKNVLTKPDQLRQRMAFALSELFVVSDAATSLGVDPLGMAGYYDMLVNDSLGNYRTLLEDVTKSPIMGRYLSMLKNRKADPANNIRPDENYAREILQLFSIGLVKLNQDGSVQLDAFLQPIPSYDQSVVEGFAQVFTGWTYAGSNSWEWAAPNQLPMQAWENYHEQGAKTLLDGAVCPAGQTAQQDLTFALDLIFQHPNIGPFIGKQLIQRFVTSNPSPEYIARVAAVFANDGGGTRGNLAAVVQAILIDPEAVNGPIDHPDTFGKLREPLLRVTALWRAFAAYFPGNLYQYWYPDEDFGQAPLRAGSVFNFFLPSYSPPGEIHDAGLVAPEFQITTEQHIVTVTNRLRECVFHGYSGYPNPAKDTALMRIGPEIVLAGDPLALVEHLNLLLMSGEMSQEMKDIVVSMVTDTDPADPRQRVLEALFLIVSSPEFSIQKWKHEKNMHNELKRDPSILSRRQLLKHGACSAAGIAGLHALWNLGLVSSAAAQGGGSDYKALVCVFLFGGCDSFNLLVPRDSAHYNPYAAARQNLGIPQNQLLPITPNTSDGSQYGLHPSCPELQALFESGKMALVANVGSLVYPMGKAQFLNESVKRPPQLFSHYDQQVQWMTSMPDANEGFGWAGRTAELLHSLNGASALSMNITLIGANTFQVGPTAAPFSMGTGGPQGLNGFSSQQGQRRYIAFQQLLNRQSSHLLEKAYADTQKRAIDTNALLESALAGSAPLATAFPDTYLGSQLAMIARTIAIRDQLGARRQVFFCGTGGFDSHDNQVQDQPGLFRELSQALSAFQAAMAELGTEGMVTTFSASDFGRSLTSNGDGSDHAWGGVQMVMGGNVVGKDIYGVYPSLALNSSDDIDGGRILPTTSVDEYSATLAKWLGVQPWDMATVFPHLNRFAHPDLGFLV